MGQKAAARRLKERSEELQADVSHVKSAGLKIGNDIDLKTENWKAKNYEIGSIAYAHFERSELPPDARFEEVLESLLAAYDQIASDLVPETLTITPPIDDGPPLIVPEEPYNLDDAMSGIFMPRSEVERILDTWRSKKNLILQGAPGVGKSFIAKRLAFALMGARAPSRIETVQFHQSYSYEDFVQGYRPTEAGGFILRDGVFARFCAAAKADPQRDYVLIIDEINRGNLSKIFGELMLLIEADKREKSWATRLAYAQPDEPKFYVPENLFILGMMNTADRSLSVVDYALRRRFAFITLRPQFAVQPFKDHLAAAGVPFADDRGNPGSHGRTQ